MSTTASEALCPQIPMGVCIDCHQEWSMSPNEKDWWDGKVLTTNASYPRRCKSCRKKKRALRGPSMLSIIHDLEAIRNSALNDFYFSNAELLVEELSEIIEDLQPFRNVRPR